MTVMDWSAVETALPDLVKTLTGVPCQWRDQPRTMHGGDGTHATLDILGQSSIGVDDSRYDDVGDPATGVQQSIRGNREMTVQVSVWSPSQKLAKAARVHLNVLRTRLRWESAQETLRGLGLALVRIEDVVDADVEQDGRIRSAATLDLRLAYIDVEQDAEIPFIETARIHGEVTDAGGEPVGDSVEMDETVTI